jgi:hypothetical protein
MEDFELTVEAIVDATCGGDRVGSADGELSFIMDNFELTVEAIVLLPENLRTCFEPSV